MVWRGIVPSADQQIDHAEVLAIAAARAAFRGPIFLTPAMSYRDFAAAKANSAPSCPSLTWTPGSFS